MGPHKFFSELQIYSKTCKKILVDPSWIKVPLRKIVKGARAFPPWELTCDTRAIDIKCIEAPKYYCSTPLFSSKNIFPPAAASKNKTWLVHVIVSGHEFLNLLSMYSSSWHHGHATFQRRDFLHKTFSHTGTRGPGTNCIYTCEEHPIIDRRSEWRVAKAYKPTTNSKVPPVVGRVRGSGKFGPKLTSLGGGKLYCRHGIGIQSKIHHKVEKYYFRAFQM